MIHRLDGIEVTALGAQVMPTSAVAILMAPIAFDTARDLGISPQTLLMAVAMSASASFLSRRARFRTARDLARAIFQQRPSRRSSR